MTSINQNELVTQYQFSKDENILLLIIEANMGMIVNCAKHMKSFDFANRVDIQDLIVAGKIGIMIAVEKFDCKRNLTFLTYAKHHIFNEITKEYAKHINMIRVPSNLTSSRRKIRQLSSDHSDKQIEKKLNLSSTILRALKRNLYTISIQSKVTNRIDGSDATLEDVIVDKNSLNFITECDNSEDNLSILDMMTKVLTPTEQEILSRRYGFNGYQVQTLESIGLMKNKSRERIRQIENIALHKLKKQLEHVKRGNKKKPDIKFTEKRFYKRPDCTRVWN